MMLPAVKTATVSKGGSPLRKILTRQQARGFVTCPQCDSHDVIKAPMAPG
jgi:hypothetical protein